MALLINSKDEDLYYKLYLLKSSKRRMWLIKMASLNEIKQKLLRQWLQIPSKSKYKFFLKDWTALKDLESCQKVLDTKRFSRNLVPTQLSGVDAKKIVVIAPHQDDDIFGAGGTLLQAVQHGSEVHVIYVTEHEDPQKKKAIYEETQQVCQISGFHSHFLGEIQNQISVDSPKLNASLLRLLIDIEPEVIFIPFLLDDHDDHRRVNELLWNVFKNSSSIKSEVWAFQVYSSVIPNVVIDISEQVETKKELMNIWQHVNGERNWAHYILGMNAMNSRWLSSKDPKYVEAFFVVPIAEYLDLCRLYFQGTSNYYGGRYATQQLPPSRFKQMLSPKKQTDSPPDEIYPLF